MAQPLPDDRSRAAKDVTSADGAKGGERPQYASGNHFLHMQLKSALRPWTKPLRGNGACGSSFSVDLTKVHLANGFSV
jgi:hypothetical protein